MSASSVPGNLFPHTRCELLSLILLDTTRWWYAAELARKMGTSPSSLQRELSNLVCLCILRRKDEGRKILYCANYDIDLTIDLQRVVRGLRQLRNHLQPSYFAMTNETTRPLEQRSNANA